MKSKIKRLRELNAEFVKILEDLDSRDAVFWTRAQAAIKESKALAKKKAKTTK